jgi:natural product precursor
LFLLEILKKSIFMKKINKLKLTQLSKLEIEKRQMNVLRGGESWTCACGCGYPDISPTSSNRTANAGYGYTSTYGWTYGADGNDQCACAGHNAEDATSVLSGAGFKK